jgi:hypothetical protein
VPSPKISETAPKQSIFSFQISTQQSSVGRRIVAPFDNSPVRRYHPRISTLYPYPIIKSLFKAKKNPPY